ncbi:MAG: site-specific integrase [Phycisphaerae bacterium]
MTSVPKVLLINRKGRKPYYFFRVGGRQYTRTKRRDAYTLLNSLLATEPVEGGLIYVAEAVREWCRLNPGDWEKGRLLNWLDFNKSAKLADVDDRHVADYLAWMKKRGFSPWTIRHNMRLAYAVLNWCHDCGWVSRVPKKPRMPVPQRVAKDIPTERLADVLDGLPAQVKPLVLFILASGCRPGEGRLLRWEQLRLDAGTCELSRHKTAGRTGRQRTIYLTPMATAILEGQPRTSEYVFTSRLDKPYTRHGLRSILANKHRKHPTFPYAMRHTFGQQALDSGERLEMVQKLLGHAKITTTAIYAEIRDERVRQHASVMTTPIERAEEVKRGRKSASNRQKVLARKAG